MKKHLLFVFLILVSGCSSTIPLLPEPYEVRYFKESKDFGLDYSFEKRCPGIGFIKASLNFSEFVIPFLNGYNLYYYIEKNVPYYILTQKNNEKYLKPKDYKIRYHGEDYFLEVPIETLKKCTISENEYVKEKDKKAEEKRKRVIAKKKAKEDAEKKQKEKIKAEQEELEKYKYYADIKAAAKNNEVMRKYGKTYCIPYKAKGTWISGGTYVERKKNCLFEKTFHVDQVTPVGVLVYDRQEVCEEYYHRYCYDENKGPYFVVPNENDKDLVDGDSISGLFEYVGPYTYQSVLGAPKTVLRFKHIE